MYQYLGTVHQGVDPKVLLQLAQELGVTQAAVRSFFRILEQQAVAPEDLDHTLRTIAQKYKALQEQLQHFTADDPTVVALKQAAQHALEAGDFGKVEVLLNEASEKDYEASTQLLEIAETRLLSAAASKAENGTLRETQLAYATAAIYYRQAVELMEPVAEGAKEILAGYLNSWGLSAYDAGNYSEAGSPLRRALAIVEEVLGPKHPDVATSLNNLALLYHAQGQYAKAEPLHQRALAIREEILGPKHPDVATILSNLALLYHAQGQYAQAEPLYQRALAIKEMRRLLHGG